MRARLAVGGGSVRGVGAGGWRLVSRARAGRSRRPGEKLLSTDESRQTFVGYYFRGLACAVIARWTVPVSVRAPSTLRWRESRYSETPFLTVEQRVFSQS